MYMTYRLSNIDGQCHYKLHTTSQVFLLSTNRSTGTGYRAAQGLWFFLATVSSHLSNVHSLERRRG